MRDVRKYVFIALGILCAIYVFLSLGVGNKTKNSLDTKMGPPAVNEVKIVQVERVSIRKGEKKNKATVVGLANEIGESYCYCFASILINGFDLLVYGPKEFPKSDVNEDNQRFKQKKRSDDDLILFSDVKDVVFVRNSKELVNQFYEMSERLHKRVIFGAEKELHPFKNKAIWDCEEFDHAKAVKHYNKLLPNEHIRDRYVNSGLFVGSFEHVCDFIQSSNFKREILYKTGCTEEQATCTITIFENSRWVGLDYYSELFYNTFGTREMLNFTMKGDSPDIINTEANTSQNRPFVIHGNGWSGGDEETRKIWKLPRESLKGATLTYDKEVVKYFDLCGSDNYKFWK